MKTARTIILDQGNPESKRAEILAYFHKTFDLDEQLYQTLRRDEAFTLRADRLRHPLIFYYGHTATFFINKLMIARVIEERLHPGFESMFAVGVDEMSWDDLDARHYDWPKPAEVKAYRDQVRARVVGLIRSLPLSLPITWESPWWILLMGIEHERIHLETSSVLIRQLPLSEVRSLPFWEPCSGTGQPPENELVPVPGGRVKLGKRRDHPLYGWDNEYGCHEADVPAFLASRMLVSNREFLAFVEDGGYRDPRWWTEEGWSWRSFKDAQYPLFWVRDQTNWRLRTMACELEMPWSWPVEVNQLEAKAFCNWLAARTGRPIRLPTEDQWHRLRDFADLPDQPYWDTAPGNLNLEHGGSSCPVDRFAQGEFFDVIGNVWQWTETPIHPFPGFEVHPCYDDFSTPTFDNRHNLIQGGSWISTGNEATRDARYAFRRHFFQHAGLRYIQSAEPVVIPEEPAETDPEAVRHLEAHWGEETLGVPNFQKAMARICLEAMQGRPARHALDLGCATGRASFELASGGFGKVTGLDQSTRHFRLAARMQEQGLLRYAFPEEGELVSFHEVSLARSGLDAVRENVAFFQADACNLPEKFTGYDLVLAALLLEDLYAPRQFLETIHTRLVLGGVLVIASAWSWSEDRTKRAQWLGGYREAGEPVRGAEGLERALAGHFRRAGEPRDVPFVLRQSGRMFLHGVAEVTIWELT